jgi:serine protease Do
MRRPLALTIVLSLVFSLSAAADVADRRSPVVRVVEKVSPAVVNVAAEAIVREPDPFFGEFFGRTTRAQSLGSGLIIDPTGVVVTNAHVIEGASHIEINTRDGRNLEADVLGFDHDSDLAVLKVDARNLPAVPLGSSSDLMIGETVIAIGNPFGLSHTVTAGVLSAVGRSVPERGGNTVFTDFLQTDASINPGNSGGPLLDVNGNVIGINTAVVRGANGIGFAIPADRARRVVGDLLRYGSLQPVWTGLRLTTLSPEVAQRRGIGRSHGVLVDRVYPGSPGAEAGLREGDVITHVQGRPANVREDVTTALYSVPVGSQVAVGVERNGAPLSLQLTPERPPHGLGLRFVHRALGLRLEEDRDTLLVTDVTPGSPAGDRGLRRGDRIVAANGQRTKTLEDLSREMLRSLERGGILVIVQRGPYQYNVTFSF